MIRYESLAEVVAAVQSGREVFWKNAGYRVEDWGAGGLAGYVVACTHNKNAIGLYWADGVRSDHDPADFYSLEGAP